jgi:hypothetical protein
MKLIELECVLMDNGEIIFNGQSLGFLTNVEIEEYTKEKTT